MTAKIVAVMAASHSPFIFTEPEDWLVLRAARDAAGIPRSNVPRDSEEGARDKHGRARTALGELKRRLDAVQPDVVLILGHDDEDQFNRNLYAPFTLFAGTEHPGYRLISFDYNPKEGLPQREGSGLRRLPKTSEHWRTYKGQPDLANDLARGLVNESIDIAVCHSLPNPEMGLAHSFTRTLEYLDPDNVFPIVPLAINCSYGPQPLGRRCVEVGRAIRAAIEGMDSDLRVAVIASGGMWHTPGAPGSYVDEDFDRYMLGTLKRGDAEGAAEYFDTAGRDLASKVAPADVWTLGAGLFNGLGNGTGQYRMWLAAAGVAEGLSAEILDYVPVYSSPSALAFADFSVTS